MREAYARWRLILGRFAEGHLGNGIGGDAAYARMDAALEYLYSREYGKRGVRDAGGRASQLSVPGWIREVRDLFPRETVEIIERHALERYELTSLVTDPEVLRSMEPSYCSVNLFLCPPCLGSTL
jgi:hypothetical protein